MGAGRFKPAGRAVLKGQAGIEFAPAGRHGARQESRTQSRGRSHACEGSADHALFEALRARRSALAKAQAVPAYVDSAGPQPVGMARSKPTTLREMGGIHGVGK